MVEIITERKKGIFNPDLADKLVLDDSPKLSVPNLVTSNSSASFESSPDIYLAIEGETREPEFWPKTLNNAYGATVRMATLADLYAFFKKGFIDIHNNDFMYSSRVKAFTEVLKHNTVFLDTSLIQTYIRSGFADYPIYDLYYQVMHNSIPVNPMFPSDNPINNCSLVNLAHLHKAAPSTVPYQTLFNDKKDPDPDKRGSLNDAFHIIDFGFKISSPMVDICIEYGSDRISRNILYVSIDKTESSPRVHLTFSDDYNKKSVCYFVRK